MRKLKKNGEARFTLFAVEIKIPSEIICTKNLDKPPIFPLSLMFYSL